MKKFYSISKTAKMVNMTSETLRHYDRIGLVHPCKTDEWTGYRYYSDSEIVRLNTIRALRCMDIPLKEIKKVLELDNMNEIVNFLQKALVVVDAKIAELTDAKERIGRAEKFYANKLGKENIKSITVKSLPARMILLSDKMTEPSVENLWEYQRNFYQQVGEDKRDSFTFEDLAGIYTTEDITRLFAVCERYEKTAGLLELPKGRYLCAECSDETYSVVLSELTKIAEEQYACRPSFTVRLVILTGILQWKYEVQLFIG